MHFERIPKTYLFSWKLTFQKCIVLECRRFIYKDSDHLNPCECGTVVYLRTTDMKVLSGRSSNPISCDLSFNGHLLSQVHYIGLVIGG